MSNPHKPVHGHVHDTADGVDVPLLGEDAGKKVLGIAGAVAVVGALLFVAGFAVNKERFAPSYLVGFSWLVTIGLGGLFFVILQHLTKAGWSIAARRQMEWVSLVLPVCALLFIPVALMGHTLYHHWISPAPEHAELIHKKAGWLNQKFFYIRAGIYIVIWTALASYFHSTSRKQDDSGDPKLTIRMQVVSAPAILLFALSLTFAGFDWLMSIDPTWYSTMFGVYIFAGSVTSSLSVLALVTIVLQQKGLFNRVSTVEHRHDIGKLMFAFVVFYAYITFCQFMLIWYANMPEETHFYALRWFVGGWKPISVMVIIGHFVVPFLFLLPRTTKRHPTSLAAAAVWLLLMHYVDMYWLVMPNFGPFAFSWLDLAGLLLPVGVLGLVIAWRAAKSPLYPLKDPRLAETMRNVNL